MLWLVALLGGLCVVAAPGFAASTILGLPFARSYPLEEIGNVPRGPRLGFDAFGRLAVIHNGVYQVLNDTVWIDLAEKTAPDGVIMSNVVHGPDGLAYYGARGSWGRAEPGPSGRLRSVPVVPDNHPEWTVTTSFADVIATDQGVYFAGWDGVVYWDSQQNRNTFFEHQGVSTIFRVGDQVYVSAHRKVLHAVDTVQGVLRPIPDTEFGGYAVDFATDLGDGRALLGVRDGRILVFDGTRAEEWPWQQRNGLTGSISAIQHLTDGGTAVAITGKGLFLVSPEGEVISSLTAPQYHRITQLASREPGVLWAVAEDTIEKVMYGGALTEFGQRLGLPVSWPTVMRWEDRIVVASRGRLYVAVPGPAGVPTRFELMSPQPAAGAWAATMSGPRMLVGNAAGVFALESDGSYTPVPTTMSVLQLIGVGPDLCFVIGQFETAVLRWADGKWSECAPRIAGIGYPTIVVHATERSAWIELGANNVARLSLEQGQIKLQTFRNLLGSEMQWVNVGVVNDTIVLSGAPGRRVFFDENTGAFGAAPELRRLLERSPHWIIRVVKDETGVIWAAHDQGVVTFTPKDGDYEMDAVTFDLINDRYPLIRILPGNDVWLSAGRSLHHAERRRASMAKRPVEPTLVSVVDDRTGLELLDRRSQASPLQLSFDRNSLSFRFFSGSYGWRRVPSYEFTLNGGSHWTTLGTGSVLSFSQLQEGNYRLEARMAGAHDAARRAVAFAFQIQPPWHRTWPAYASYSIGLALCVFGLIRWSGQRVHRRNLALEQVVRERTSELKAAMEKLNEETRNTATLAERDRLAGEIHDSLQQGLSGLMLQLDATLKLPSVSTDVRSRLNVARNMVSFTRHEVQHAVWDMESPLLEDTELGEALSKLTALINSGTAAMNISVSGPPVFLPPTIKHHLLRIAQEGITNAVRHSSARDIAVRLEYGADRVTLEVADDGVGFDPDDVISRSVGHFGLRGLRSRAAKIGGELSIESAPGRGARLRVVVLLPAPAGISPDASNGSA